MLYERERNICLTASPHHLPPVALPLRLPRVHDAVELQTTNEPLTSKPLDLEGC